MTRNRTLDWGRKKQNQAIWIDKKFSFYGLAGGAIDTHHKHIRKEFGSFLAWLIKTPCTKVTWLKRLLEAIFVPLNKYPNCSVSEVVAECSPGMR